MCCIKSYYLIIYLVRDDVRIIPRSKAAALGSDAIFTCLSSHTVRWYFEPKDRFPQSTPISIKKNLKIYPVKKENAGFYFCYGTLDIVKDHFLAKAELVIKGELK